MTLGWTDSSRSLYRDEQHTCKKSSRRVCCVYIDPFAYIYPSRIYNRSRERMYIYALIRVYIHDNIQTCRIYIHVNIPVAYIHTMGRIYTRLHHQPRFMKFPWVRCVRCALILPKMAVSMNLKWSGVKSVFRHFRGHRFRFGF